MRESRFYEMQSSSRDVQVMRISVPEIPYLCEKIDLCLDVFPHAGNEQPLHLRVDLRLDPQLLVPLL